MKMSESAEDYLETILILQGQKPHVRSIDIVSYLDFSKPSVSTAMKRLRENGLILMDEDGYITLTKSGREIAEKIYAVSYTHLARPPKTLGSSRQSRSPFSSKKSSKRAEAYSLMPGRLMCRAKAIFSAAVRIALPPLIMQPQD